MWVALGDAFVSVSLCIYSGKDVSTVRRSFIYAAHRVCCTFFFSIIPAIIGMAACDCYIIGLTRTTRSLMLLQRFFRFGVGMIVSYMRSFTATYAVGHQVQMR
ncbi:hypothetical protein O9929_13635 [Vibrio lentus]|nr:hypothetical protein [Vibrio lentus]